MAIRSVALAGMVSDTSLYNIDGACVVGGAAAIPVGTVVRALAPGDDNGGYVDGYKQVVGNGHTANSAYGVVVRSHYETPDGTAKVQEAVNVMTAGRIWVRASAAPPAGTVIGAPITVNAGGLVSVAAADASNFETGWTFAGGVLTAYAASADPIKQGQSVDGILIEVQVKQK